MSLNYLLIHFLSFNAQGNSVKALVWTVLFVLAGCTTSNSVNRNVPDDAVVNYSDVAGYEDRYSNLYDDFRAYPVTCEENCYPPSPLIDCETDMQDCQFTGTNPDSTLNAGFTVTWLGHASFQIQTATGEQFLIDPVFNQFDWPVNWAFRIAEGFNRTPAEVPEAVSIENTNAVLYSHIHYDHFHKGDIADIGTAPSYLVPLGFADHFPEDGYRVTEMAWYASEKIGATTAHFVPAQHFSSRIMVPYLYEDNDKTLWGGWVLEQGGKTLFFAGDTGYSPHFKDIAKKYGDIDVCLLPIASYFSEESPRWYRKVHTTPEDALIAATELNCKVMIPWGYGNASWRMGDKTSHSALFRLLYMKKQLTNEIPLHILNEGESARF